MMRRTPGVACVAAMLIVILGAAPARFRPPDRDQRQAAVGKLDGLNAKVFDDSAFEPMDEPGPSDWLANHREDGQTFDEYAKSRPNTPTGKRKVLYLQPLGEFPRDSSPPLDRIQSFAAAFFMMDVKVLPPLDLKQAKITRRINRGTGQEQLLTSDIMDLLKRKLPDDAFALLGITMTDLYPEESWNYVFGQATLAERVGVYSFARYDPRFFGQKADAGTPALMLKRSCAVLAHETVHMFGIHHCIYYRCLENGSNNLAESDSRPMHLCPVDLRKLQHAVGFDVLTRYRKLHEFCSANGIDDEAKWLMAEIKRIEGK